jgi:8-oxo-dGTP pyrophosphatase MutT (NUDIX family)
MGFEPQKFFIGMIDFFSVWLPGAILAYALKDVGTLILFGSAPPVGVEFWVVFLLVSYLAGHFIFLIGSAELDPIYDEIKGGKAHPGIVLRWLAGNLDRKDDEAVGRAQSLKNAYLRRLQASSAVNAFQWSKARLALEHPEALALVNRFEADSKFFRSLCVLLPFLGVAQLILAALAGYAIVSPSGKVAAFGHVLAALVALALIRPTFTRYVALRRKSTDQAYWLILALETGRDEIADFLKPPPDGLTHAGGVVVRGKGDLAEFAVVESKTSKQLVLPKGHIELGETAEQAAVRETLEEAGVWARILAPLTDKEFIFDGARIKVRFFLMEYVGEETAKRERKPEWRPLGEHDGLLPESRDAVVAAERYLNLRAGDQAGSSSAATVSSIQPPPSSCSPS